MRHTIVFALMATYATSAFADQAVAGSAFVNSVGVNVHLRDKSSLYYKNYPLVRQALLNLGVHHLRDGVLVPRAGDVYYNRLNELGNLGIKGLFITNPAWTNIQTQAFPAYVRSSFEMFEGLNEWDGNFGALSLIRSYSSWLYSATKSGSNAWAHVVGPSFVMPSSYSLFSGLSSYMDYGNVHYYPGGRNPGTAGWGGYDSDGNRYGSIPYSLRLEKNVSGSKKVYMTETGYTNQVSAVNWVTQSVAAIYMPRLLLESWNAGVKRTYIYELLSAGHEDYGLMTSSGAYKPAFYAVSNLLKLLDESASFSGTSLNYTLNGGDSSLHKLLLQKSDGSYYLALWVEKPCYNPDLHITIPVSSQAITLNTPRNFSSVMSYQWKSSGAVVSTTLASGNSWALTISDKLQIIKLTP